MSSFALLGIWRQSKLVSQSARLADQANDSQHGYVLLTEEYRLAQAGRRPRRRLGACGI
jgi:hypothetical protein